MDSLTMTYSTFKAKQSIGLSGPDGATIAGEFNNKIASFSTAVYGLQNTSQFGSGNLVSVTGDSPPESNFSSSPLYGQTTFVDADGVTQYGYFEGITSGVNFTLIDYGIVTPNDTAVPEPSTLALLASGVAGIVSLRRRRAAGH